MQEGPDRRASRPAGPIDIVLAALALASCFYVAIRYPELIRELVDRPWCGVAIASIIVLLVFEASRRVTGLVAGADRARAVRARAARLDAAGDLCQPAVSPQPPDGLSRRRHQCAARRPAADRGRRGPPFIIMGHVLARCGGSDFFADLAAAADGPVPRRRRQDRGRRLGLLRHDVGQRRRQCGERRHHHHSADEARRLSAAYRRRRSRRSARPAARSRRP